MCAIAANLLTEDETSCTMPEDVPALTDVVPSTAVISNADVPTTEEEPQEDTEQSSLDGKASPPTIVDSPPRKFRLPTPTPQLVHSKSLGYTSGNRCVT